MFWLTVSEMSVHHSGEDMAEKDRSHHGGQEAGEEDLGTKEHAYGDAFCPPRLYLLPFTISQ